MILLKCFSPQAVKPLDETAWYCVYKVVRKGITTAMNAHLVLFPTSLSFHLIIKDGPDSGVHSANFPGQSYFQLRTQANFRIETGSTPVGAQTK